jgi:hypothetical protein
MRINTLQQGNLMTMKQLGHATKEIIEHGLLASSNNIMEALSSMMVEAEARGLVEGFL